MAESLCTAQESRANPANVQDLIQFGWSPRVYISNRPLNYAHVANLWSMLWSKMIKRTRRVFSCCHYLSVAIPSITSDHQRMERNQMGEEEEWPSCHTQGNMATWKSCPSTTMMLLYHQPGTLSTPPLPPQDSEDTHSWERWLKAFPCWDLGPVLLLLLKGLLISALQHTSWFFPSA